MTIPAETRAFLTALYRRSKSYLTLSTIHPDKSHPTPSRHIPLADMPALEKGLHDLLVANRGGWGAVFSVATRKANLGRWRRDGVHIYWWMVTPTTDWLWASAALSTLAEQLGGDRTTVAGAMRLPGTINTKPDRDGARCTLHTLNDYHYIKEDFMITLPKTTETVAVRDPPRRRRRSSTPIDRTLNPQLIQVVRSRLLADGGHIQSNGWIAAICPCGHRHDRPGAHFAFNPSIGVGVCHGRHGRLLLRELCGYLNLDPIHYGGLYA
jgi:hypothetical protein